jgi:hypothetical protein
MWVGGLFVRPSRAFILELSLFSKQQPFEQFGHAIANRTYWPAAKAFILSATGQ